MFSFDKFKFLDPNSTYPPIKLLFDRTPEFFSNEMSRYLFVSQNRFLHYDVRVCRNGIGYLYSLLRKSNKIDGIKEFVLFDVKNLFDFINQINVTIVRDGVRRIYHSLISAFYEH